MDETRFGQRERINYEIVNKQLDCSPRSVTFLTGGNSEQSMASSQIHAARFPIPLDSVRTNAQLFCTEKETDDAHDRANDVGKIKGSRLRRQESKRLMSPVQEPVASQRPQPRLPIRRTYIIAVEEEDNMKDLKTMAFKNCRRKSSMKVRTLQESLHSCSSTAQNDSFLPNDVSMPLSVSFHTVEIREYERTIGDNPCCTSGPPIALGWEVKNTNTFSLNEHEDSRPKDRPVQSWFLSRFQREDILRECGASRRDIANATRSLIKAKTKRCQTINNLKVSRMEEAFQSLQRKMKRCLLRRRKNYDIDRLYEKQAKRASLIIREENEAAMKAGLQDMTLKRSNTI